MHAHAKGRKHRLVGYSENCNNRKSFPSRVPKEREGEMVLLEVTITRELELQKSGFSVGKRNLMITKDRVLIKGGRGDEKYNFLFFSPSYPIPLRPVMIPRRGQLAREPREVSSDIAFKAQKSKAQQGAQTKKGERGQPSMLCYSLVFCS